MNPSAVDMTRFPELAAPERILPALAPAWSIRAMRAMVMPVVGHGPDLSSSWTACDLRYVFRPPTC